MKGEARPVWRIYLCNGCLEAHDRAIASALTAIVTYVGIFSAFNVFLEAPYVGPLFWAAAGMLAVVCIQRPAAGKAPLTPQR